MKIAVFCGSGPGNDPVYSEAATELGQFLASEGIGLVYGGGRAGLMGSVADAALAAGGEVTGVIPVLLERKEIAHTGLTELISVADMHSRKAKMAELADAFIAMPGGAGTMEEFFEVWTWGQLGYHSKPCAILNTAGYFGSLLTFIGEMQEKEFLKQDYRDMLLVSEQIPELISRIRSYTPPVRKWQ